MVGRGKAALDFMAGTVAEMKRRFDNPIIVVGGDFNQWDIGKALEDFPDLLEALVGPTRGDRSIDRIFQNVRATAAGTLPALETDHQEPGSIRRSDHAIAYSRTDVEKHEKI